MEEEKMKMGKKNKGNIDEVVLLKRTMTKKEFQNYQKSQRSVVTIGMNTGTRTMKSEKDYNRSKNKVDLRKVDLY